jgi:GMP synthase-like glutamine amidotransferase
MPAHQTLLILDFGSQYTQLIARRVRELSVRSEIRRGDLPGGEIRAIAPIGIVLSGGPSSIYEDRAITRPGGFARRAGARRVLWAAGDGASARRPGGTGR